MEQQQTLHLDIDTIFNHVRRIDPPKKKYSTSELTPIYPRLSSYLAINPNTICPIIKSGRVIMRHRLYPADEGIWGYPVEWMPKLKDGWRRLTFEEFCNWYNQ